MWSTADLRDVTRKFANMARCKSIGWEEKHLQYKLDRERDKHSVIIILLLVFLFLFNETSGYAPLPLASRDFVFEGVEPTKKLTSIPRLKSQNYSLKVLQDLWEAYLK